MMRIVQGCPCSLCETARVGAGLPRLTIAEAEARDPLSIEHAQFTRMVSPDDNHATLELVHSLRTDPDRDAMMGVLAQLATASKGLPIHFAWNRLWWVLYTPTPPKPKSPRRRKR
jgi:hypothetical protein